MAKNFITKPLVVLAAALVSTVYSDEIPNDECKGIHLVFDMTVATACSVVVTLQGKDGNGVWYDMLTSAAKTTVATTRFSLFPGATASNNIAVNEHLPAKWRVRVAIADNGGTAAVTATVGAVLLV